MGSASRGMSIVLSVMADQYNTVMGLYGIDTLPHNGAVITLLVVTSFNP